MLISLDNLPENPAELKKVIAELKQQHDTELDDIKQQHDTVLDELKQEYSAEIELLKEQLRLALHRQFGRSSEAMPGQGTLFDEAETVHQSEAAAEEIEVPAHRRKRGGRKPLPEHLPRIDIVHELDEKDRHCPHDGTRLIEIGEEVTEQLDYEPAKVWVRRLIRKKYACPCCDEHVARAPVPAQLIPKSQASAGLLAQIAISKYQDALPLYRQEQIFTRLGVDLDRTLMANWMIKVGEALEPLIDCLQHDLLAAEVLHGDETTVQVLKEEGRRADQKSYMWVQATATGPPIVLYHYTTGRSQQVVTDLFGDFCGTLVTDGYAAYNVLTQACHAGCWAHVRRRFHEALKAQSGNRIGKAQIGLNYTQKLFALERQFKDLSNEKRRAQRQALSQPVLDDLRAWLDQSLPTVAPQSLVGRALTYLNNQWTKLVTFMDDGAVPISNNLVENKIRPFVIGRKNWIFSDSVAGVNASAAIYSLIETVKANDLDPYLYLRWLFKVLPGTNADDPQALRQLLPYRCNRDEIVEVLSREHFNR